MLNEKYVQESNQNFNHIINSWIRKKRIISIGVQLSKIKLNSLFIQDMIQIHIGNNDH